MEYHPWELCYNFDTMMIYDDSYQPLNGHDLFEFVKIKEQKIPFELRKLDSWETLCEKDQKYWAIRAKLLRGGPFQYFTAQNCDIRLNSFYRKNVD